MIYDIIFLTESFELFPCHFKILEIIPIVSTYLTVDQVREKKSRWFINWLMKQWIRLETAMQFYVLVCWDELNSNYITITIKVFILSKKL